MKVTVSKLKGFIKTWNVVVTVSLVKKEIFRSKCCDNAGRVDTMNILNSLIDITEDNFILIPWNFDTKFKDVKIGEVRINPELNLTQNQKEQHILLLFKNKSIDFLNGSFKLFF